MWVQGWVKREVERATTAWRRASATVVMIVLVQVMVAMMEVMTAVMTVIKIVRMLRWVRSVAVCVVAWGRVEGWQGLEAGAGVGAIAVAVVRGVRGRG